MRYVVGNIEIRSENAAKTMTEAAAPVVTWIRSQARVRRALDYGCGKLRYTPHIAERCERLGIVDSQLQLERRQVIGGEPTTVTDYVRARWPSCRIYPVERFWSGVRERYDLVLCANVLSTIPSQSVRAKSLRAINAALRPGGQVLVVNQHRNSEFRVARERPGAKPHLDGWSLPSRRGTCYYGILDEQKVIRLLRAAGFSVVDAWKHDQSNFVLAEARSK